MGQQRNMGAGFPPEVTGNRPRLVLYGNEELMVEQHRGIVACARDRMGFQTACGIVCVEGDHMELTRYGPWEACVKGKITRIEYQEDGRG